jgi:hypothetical protein
MARKKTTPQQDPGPPSLAVPRAEAEARIDKQIEAGRELLARTTSLNTTGDFEDWREDRSRWRRFTSDVLRALYTTEAPADEFDRAASRIMYVMGKSPAEQLEDDRDDMRSYVNTLVSLRERLELVPGPADEPGDLGAGEAEPQEGDPRVFVVHGHDEAVREKLVRQLEKAGRHDVVVLHEKASRGKTIIEKLEQNAKRSDYAVVLLTGDDVGASAKDAEKLQPRARQNVVFELGYFVGALGRSHVAVLYEENVELPSDYAGVVYIPLGDETWRFKLLQELKDAGFDYDLNKIISA